MLAGDLDSLKRQRIVLAVLDLSLLAILLFLHTWFASFWGTPSGSLTALLGGCFVIRGSELVWLRRLWGRAGLIASRRRLTFKIDTLLLSGR